MAPVVSALRMQRRFRVSVAVSGQHRGMLDQVTSLFGIRITDDLDLMRASQSISDVTVGVLKGFEAVLRRRRPDLVLVHGDTTTTMAGTLASFYRRIPVGHVEAGLRTRDLSRPFPEEANRQVTDALSTLWFAPTTRARDHLLAEGRPPDRVFVTGNTVIDALFTARGRAKSPADGALRRALSRIPETAPLVLMTAHRRENFGSPMERIFLAIRRLSLSRPDVHWVYPVHPNPNVAPLANRLLGGRPNVHLIPPAGYGELVYLMNRARLVITDSGGLQEEAPAIGKPVLVLRDVTERPEAVEAGTVRLVGSEPKRIISLTGQLLRNSALYREMANAVSPYGDGRAAQRIRDAIEWYFGLRRSRPVPFHAGARKPRRH